MTLKKQIKSKYVINDKQAKAAKPTPTIKKDIFYHGTPTGERAEKIWKEGILPDLSITPEHEISKPVSGRVYCTNSIKYAVIYALGGDVAGNSRPLFIDKYGQYCYIFVISGKQLKNIHPDEDNVGQAIHDKKFTWLTQLANQYLRDEDQPDANDEGEYGALLDGIYDGDYASWIKAGKILLPQLTDSQKLDIIKEFGNIAHDGALHPSEMWQFDRALTSDLKRDGSNFFQLAKKIKSK